MEDEEFEKVRRMLKDLKDSDFKFDPCPANMPPYESGQIWTSSSTIAPGDGFEPADILIREMIPLKLFMWNKRADPL